MDYNLLLKKLYRKVEKTYDNPQNGTLPEILNDLCIVSRAIFHWKRGILLLPSGPMMLCKLL